METSSPSKLLHVKSLDQSTLDELGLIEGYLESFRNTGLSDFLLRAGDCLDYLLDTYKPNELEK